MIRHAEGCDWWSQDKSHIAEAVEVVRNSDIAVVAVGTRSTYLGRSPKYSTAGTSWGAGGAVEGDKENGQAYDCRSDCG